MTVASIGILTCNYLEEASDEPEATKRRVVDEAEAPAPRLSAESAAVRTAAVGGNEGRR